MKFTDRVKNIMLLANREAQRLNHEYISTEHLLYGTLIEGRSAAMMLLGGVDPKDILKTLDSNVCPGQPLVSIGKLPTTPRAKKAIELADNMREKLGHDYIGGAHLFYGMVAEREGIAATVLASHGITAESVGSALKTIAIDAHPEAPSHPFGVQLTLRDWFAGQALNGLVSRKLFDVQSAAKTAYEYADAMLEAKK